MQYGNRLNSVMVLCLLLGVSGLSLAEEDWVPVTGVEALTEFMAGTTLEWAELGEQRGRGEYRADGTGTLYAWGAEFPRTWKVEGDDRICVTGEPASGCYRIEQSTADPALFRAIDVGTGESVKIRKAGTDGRAEVSGDPAVRSKDGGAAAASSAEIARELANPNTALASLTFKSQYRLFDGDLPDAGSQSSYTMLFQPVLPFPLTSGGSIMWRPGIPLLVEQPVFDAENGTFDGKTAMGDIGFDVVRTHNLEGGLLLAYGLYTTLPTATADELETGRWTIGPEFLIGKMSKKYVLGILPNHAWDYAGWTDRDVSLTTMSVFAVWLPGGGWSYSSAPIINYDWISEQWTVPLNITVGNTVMSKGGRPWKLSVEANYYVEKADAFGPEWMFSFNVTPVVKNKLADLFK
jgi:hypothetical protein